ncbi:MAG: LPS export ABC transporter periplasmic protein LptC [Balneolaceae bacterium]
MTKLTLYRASETQVIDTSVPRKIIRLLPLLFLLLVSCTGLSDYDSEQVKAGMNDSLVTTTESWDVELLLMNDGNARIFIQGSHAVSYQSADRKETQIEGPVYVQLYDTTGAVETEAWSKRAVYLDSESDFELFDSVRVETVTDRQLYSDYLRYSRDTDRITSPRFVTIITPSDSISGQGFDGLTDLSSYTITDPRGRLIVD